MSLVRKQAFCSLGHRLCLEGGDKEGLEGSVTWGSDFKKDRALHLAK